MSLVSCNMLAKLIPIPECVYMVCVAIYALQEGHAKRGGGGGMVCGYMIPCHEGLLWRDRDKCHLVIRFLGNIHNKHVHTYTASVK